MVKLSKELIQHQFSGSQLLKSFAMSHGSEQIDSKQGPGVPVLTGTDPQKLGYALF